MTHEHDTVVVESGGSSSGRIALGPGATPTSTNNTTNNTVNPSAAAEQAPASP
jgi:hypothetical protein